MLVRPRAASDQRSTLASSVVATVVFGALSGYGYGPTLASSVLALGALSGYCHGTALMNSIVT